MNKHTLNNLEFYQVIDILCTHIETSLGKTIAKKIRISNSLGEIEKLQEETEEAKNLIISGTDMFFSGLVDITEKIKLASLGSMIDTMALINIAQNFRLARINKAKISKKEVDAIKGFGEILFTNKELEDRIFEAIISENEISDKASSELNHIRREMKKLNENIKTKLNQIVSSLNNLKYFQDAIITQRQDRYVIPVKAEYKSFFPGIVHDTSSSGATLFIEPVSVVEMNNSIRVLRAKEKEEIERILLALSVEAGAYYNELISNQKTLSYLDFIFGKAKFALKTNSIYPNLNDKKEIDLKNAKHPLLKVSNIVPLNIKIGKDYNTLVITGPNTGGKTVTLKTVGLFVLMVQAGLQIPCDYGSKIAIFSKVFSDIGDDQSISQNLSTFSSHMTNIVKILQKTDENTLLLLDELGSGTDPDEGSALAIAILEYLKNKNAITIATTHYTNLKHYAINTENVENASVEFNVETLSPTYNLLIGIPGKSNAFHISKKLGLRHDIIEKAKEYVDSDILKMEDLLLRIEKNKRSIEREKSNIKKIKQEYDEKFAFLLKEESKIQKEKERILKEAKKEAKSIVNITKEESKNIIEELKNIKTSNLSEVKGKLKNLESGFNDEDLIPKDFDGDLTFDDIKIGDVLYAPSFDKNGTVVSLDTRKKKVVLQIDSMKINLPLNSLAPEKKMKVVNNYSGSGNIYSKKASNIKQEIDVRGIDLELALEEVVKYIDDAYLSNIPQVTIIHGVGNRILKNGIMKHISNIKYIKKIREGNYSEGGIGVTIVSFVD